MNKNIFRSYDIRGVVDVELSEALVEDLGRALGTLARRRGAARFGVGRDCRLHSPRLRDALVRGLVSTGLRVTDVGQVPTPLLYFAALTQGLDGGVQLTGSHNPPEFNGFKMMIGADTIYGDDIQALRRLIEAQDFERGEGAVETLALEATWLERVCGDVKLGPWPAGRRLKIVVDGGNGVGGPLAVALLERLGAEVIGLYIEPDGRFPNHHPDPSEPHNLQALIQAVQAHGADLGVAYDGDADRLGVVDDQGRIIFGDHLLALLARDVLRQEPGATIVAEVKCSQTLFDDVRAHGGQGIMWKVGHSLIKAHMKATGALLAGEMSGHIFYKHRYLGIDDALYATARLVELLTHQGGPLSGLLDAIPTLYGTPEVRVEAPDERKFAIAEAVAARLGAEHEIVTLDGVRVILPEGWGLVRASNTQPALVLRAEGRTPEARDAILRLLHATIAAVA